MSNKPQFHARRRAVAIPIGSSLPSIGLSLAAGADLAAAFGRRVSAALGRRRDAHLLAQVDDHMLRDMGITRSQIDGVVRFGRF